MPVNSIQDSNQVFSQLFTAGSAGTADTKGTSGVVAGAADPATGAQYVTILGGGASNPSGGTLNSLGTLQSGTINSATINTGTINAGTINSATINTGTINAATVNAGTFTANGGTIGIIQGGTVAVNMLSGTINLGTVVNNGGTVNVVQNAGTIQGGTIGVVSAITSGTVATNMLSGTLNLGTTVENNGTLAMLKAGTISNATVNTGTINAATINTGTINSATINAGTVSINNTPIKTMLDFGTTTTGTIGTLVAAPGAGTALWINNLSVIASSGTPDVAIGFGTAAANNGGAQRLLRGVFSSPSGGIAKHWPIPSKGGTTNTDLVFWVLSGGGTTNIDVSYYKE